MKETDIILAIRKHLAQPPGQRNRPFEADAEIAEIGGQLLAFTTDEFSAEDGFSLRDPRTLGWNLATATMSDLLAVGAEPRFMLHSLVASDEADRGVLEGISAGLREALDAFGADMLGGDVGTGDAWRYTGFAVGTFPPGAGPITRRMPPGKGLLVATGTFGDANVAVARCAVPPRFECRLAEARRIAAAPAACIDTSDGLLRAVETLAEVNPGARIVVDIDAVPYAAGVREYASSLHVRPEAFLLASAGEYELLACVPEARSRELAQGGVLGVPAAVHCGGGPLAVIGSFDTAAGRRSPRGGGVWYRTGRGDDRHPHAAIPDPREVGDLAAYRTQIVALARSLFGPPE